MIEISGISTPPDITYSKAHYYCDYIELVSLFSGGDTTSSEDIYDRFFDSDIINEEDGDSWNGSDVSSEYIQKWKDRIDSWFQILEVRSKLYGAYYPFNVYKKTIEPKPEINGHKNILYIGLLLSSCNKYHNKKNILASFFEEISRQALEAYLGNHCKAYRFGVSNLTNSRYTGSLYDKIKKLSEDIDCELTRKKNVFREGDNGDGGIDIVAWLNFPNDTNLSRGLLFLGQSATGKNWPEKQASVSRLKNYIYIPESTHNVLFIPYDLRDSERYFEEEGKITASLIFDRYRIISLVDSDQMLLSQDFNSFCNIVASALDYEEDLV